MKSLVILAHLKSRHFYLRIDQARNVLNYKSVVELKTVQKQTKEASRGKKATRGTPVRNKKTCTKMLKELKTHVSSDEDTSRHTSVDY